MLRMLYSFQQGAGGNGNVLKELVDSLGARIQLSSIPVGDPTLSGTCASRVDVT
jgi:phosphoribosylformylglycinamidine (FGAM) synthase-like enzyme